MKKLRAGLWLSIAAPLVMLAHHVRAWEYAQVSEHVIPLIVNIERLSFAKVDVMDGSHCLDVELNARPLRLRWHTASQESALGFFEPQFNSFLGGMRLSSSIISLGIDDNGLYLDLRSPHFFERTHFVIIRDAQLLTQSQLALIAVIRRGIFENIHFGVEPKVSLTAQHRAIFDTLPAATKHLLNPSIAPLTTKFLWGSRSGTAL